MNRKMLFMPLWYIVFSQWMVPATAQEKKYLPLVTKTIPAGFLYASDPIVGNLRYVPAGTYTQGTPSSEADHNISETQFQHILTKNMAVMETEVIRQMWADLMAQAALPADPTCIGYGSGTTNPVQCVRWYEAVLFANLLSQLRGLTPAYYADAAWTTPINASNYNSGSVFAKWDTDGFRLPTEGEWEYFTRAGTTGPFSISEPAYGSLTQNSCTAGVLAALESVAWYCANQASTWDPETRAVGSKAANPWGLKDVHGNVSEWCWDWYTSSYPGSVQSDYRGPATGSYRVTRGGSYSDYPRNVRSGNRSYQTPTHSNYGNVGFRLLRQIN